MGHWARAVVQIGQESIAMQGQWQENMDFKRFNDLDLKGLYMLCMVWTKKRKRIYQIASALYKLTKKSMHCMFLCREPRSHANPVLFVLFSQQLLQNVYHWNPTDVWEGQGIQFGVHNGWVCCFCRKKVKTPLRTHIRIIVAAHTLDSRQTILSGPVKTSIYDDSIVGNVCSMVVLPWYRMQSILMLTALCKSCSDHASTTFIINWSRYSFQNTVRTSSATFTHWYRLCWFYACLQN